MVFVTGFSFGIGLFLVFFTNLGGEIDWTNDVPLDFLLFSLFGFQTINFSLGLVFLFFWLIYLTCYLFCLLKPTSLARLPLLMTKRDLVSRNIQIDQF